ncbi:MAG: helix-turn-helix domain-containing protein [Thermoguttaceae bacterium]|jgi:predicted ArsR family transcriptional regulator
MVEATVSAAGLKIVKLLVGNPPHSVTDLIQATGVTRTAVTEQLHELVTTGFVEQSAERLPGRGRPRYLYKATNDALVLLFSSNQRLVVPAIWKAIDEIGGGELRSKVLKKVSRTLAEHYNKKITAKKPEDRLHQLMAIFIEEGGILEALEEDGKLVVYKRSCPFISMIDDNLTICTVDLDMMSQVVGRPVLRTACRHEGDPCCKIEIQK